MFGITRKSFIGLVAATGVLASGSGLVMAGAASAAPPQPCYKLFYRGSANNPTQIQLICNGGDTQINLNGPFRTGANNTVHKVKGGIHVSDVVLIRAHDQLRTFYSVPGRDKVCVFVRYLKTQGPRGGSASECHRG